MIIAICGKKHSGKSTAENMIRRLIIESNRSCDNITLADPIKQIGSFIVGDNRLDWDNDAKKKEIIPMFKITRREFMTKFGTDFIHELNPMTWCIIANRELAKSTCTHNIITDIRMVHEANWLRGKGKSKAIIIKLEGDPADLEDGHNSNHKSELEVESIKADYVIDTNISTKADMIYSLKQILKEHNII